MGRTSGTPNKITAEVKGKLENLIEGLEESFIYKRYEYEPKD